MHVILSLYHYGCTRLFMNQFGKSLLHRCTSLAHTHFIRTCMAYGNRPQIMVFMFQGKLTFTVLCKTLSRSPNKELST